MAQYEIRFMFDYGAGCLWSVNSEAREKYGCFIESDSLPISDMLISSIEQLTKEYDTYLNWDYPPDPSPWSEEHKQDFITRSEKIYEQLCSELGDDYTVINEIKSCVE